MEGLAGPLLLELLVAAAVQGAFVAVGASMGQHWSDERAAPTQETGPQEPWPQVAPPPQATSRQTFPIFAMAF